MKTEKVIQLLDGVVLGTITIEGLQKVRQELADMQAEGRDPTDEEVDAMFTRIDADADAISAARDRLAP